MGNMRNYKSLFLVSIKINSLPDKPIKIVNVLEPIEVKGKKKSKKLFI